MLFYEALLESPGRGISPFKLWLSFFYEQDVVLGDEDGVQEGRYAMGPSDSNTR